jgi:hypothetical protein
VQKLFCIMHSPQRSGFPVELYDADLPLANDPVLIDVNDSVHDDAPLKFEASIALNRNVLIHAG